MLAPVLGAIGDRGGRRKQFLMAWTLLGVGATGALYFVGAGRVVRCAALLFVLGDHGLQRRHRVQRLAAARCRASPRELDRVSAFGYSLGYLGGGLLFLVNVLMVQQARVVRPRGCGARRCACPS